MNPTNVTKYWLKALVNTVFIKESLYMVGAKKDVSIIWKPQLRQRLRQLLLDMKA